MLEVALDGALVKFIMDEIEDPVCQAVFKKINADESRHLAVDFAVIEMLGHSTTRKLVVETVGAWLNPALIIGTLRYIPLLNKMRDNIVYMGVNEERLYTAMKRFRNVGERSPAALRVPMYRVVKWHGNMVINRNHPYHLLADRMVKVTGRLSVQQALIPSRPGPRNLRTSHSHEYCEATCLMWRSSVEVSQESERDSVEAERYRGLRRSSNAAREVGGTWRDNTYPGAACDIPSRLYSYSFAPNPDWSHTYSASAEILGYIRTMVKEFGLGAEAFGFRATSRASRWDEADRCLGRSRFEGREAVISPDRRHGVRSAGERQLSCSFRGFGELRRTQDSQCSLGP